MNIYFAPLEGIGGYIYRNAHKDYFGSVDKYFSPFVVTRPSGIMKKKELKDILPENNEDINLVPQIMTNNAQGFCKAAEQIAQMGYEEVNLNLGCPSGTVVGKGRGSGFLKDPRALDEFLDEIYSTCKINISIKTRIGFYEPEEFYNLIKIFNKYPVYELIIHPRTRMELYNGSPEYQIFDDAVKLSKNELCYNGDIKTKEDYEMIAERYEGIKSVMIGRGFLRNPNLADEIKYGDTLDKNKLKEFHDRLYSDYKEIYDGEKPVLFKMKELWFYMVDLFADNEKYIKKIRKVQHLSEFEAIVSRGFKELKLL